MIVELEQCHCGIVFEAPITKNPQFHRHIRNGVHEDAMTVSICGPCFAFLCYACDKRRRNGPWACACRHDGHQKTTRVRAKQEQGVEMRLTWSTWLNVGRPCEATINQL